MIYSDKQLKLMRLWQDRSLKRINILQGSVRSGKTWISLVLWAFWVASMPDDRQFLMVAKTLTSLRRNCLDLLQSLIGTANFTYSLSKKEAHLFGRVVYLEGVNDARAESKIRGMTLQGAYCDELTLFTEDFFAMLLSRLSDKGALLIATTNPDIPTHWLKMNYLNRARELDLLSVEFKIDDNPYLDPEYVANIKHEYTGAFYSRFIEGNWVRAEGLIYPMFERTAHVIEAAPEVKQGYAEYVISCDYGTSNPTAALYWCIQDGVGYCLGEYYHDGRRDGQRTDEEHVTGLLNAGAGIDPAFSVSAIYADPSAASFITALKRHTDLFVYEADNNVSDGIRNVASFLQNKRILFHESCVNTIREFQTYCWNDRAIKEEPLKENDHCMDSCRYLVRSLLRRQFSPFF